MAKVQIKSEKLTPFGVFFSIMEQFDTLLAQTIDSIGLSQHLDNPIENCVRSLAIGRKNNMFCGNHDAAEEAAIIHTMMGCKLAGVHFRKWTPYFLTHIHGYDNDYSKDSADFLPQRLREKRIL